MVAEILVEETRLPLTGEMVEAGRQFVRQLQENVALTAGFWLFVPESNSWRLYVATADLRDLGARPLYLVAQRLLQEQRHLQVMKGEIQGGGLFTLTLPDIYAVDDRQQLVGTLRTLAERQNRRADFRVSRTTANGHFIEDAYIYTI